MATYQETALLRTSNTGSYLLVSGVRDLNRSDLERDDTRYAEAFHGQLDGRKTAALLTCATLPRPPSRSDAKSHSKMAQMQLQLAESGDYSAQQSAHYKSNYRKYEYAAEQSMRQHVWLPTNVAASESGHAVVSIITDTRSMMLGRERESVLIRHFDVTTGDIIFEERVKAMKGGFASPEYHRYTNIRGLDASGKRILVLKPDNRRSAANRPLVSLEERSLEKGLPVVSSTDRVTHSPNILVADNREHWVWCSGNYPERGATLAMLDKQSGKLVEKIKLSRDPCTIAMSPTGAMVVCGFIGGGVWVVELATHKIRKFNPHIGAGRNEWARVHVAGSEAFFLSETLDQLVLTDLSDGASTFLEKPRPVQRECEPFDGVDTSITIGPAIAIIGDEIAVSEDNKVKVLPADVEAYDNTFVSEVGRKGARKPVKVSRKAPIEETFAKARLEAHTKTLLGYRSPAVTLHSKKLGKRGWAPPGIQHAPELGGSRFGGWPDIPEDMQWPSWRGKPMAFLGQLNLAEAHAAESGLRLPESGLLSFFLGCSEESYTRESDSRERYMVDLMPEIVTGNELGWHVEYTPASAGLRRLTIQDGPFPELFNPATLRFRSGGKALPDEQSTAFELLDFSNAEKGDYLEMIEQLQASHGYHQLMGYPSVIQFMPPELYCEVQGYDLPADENSSDYKDLIRKASEWTLLLELTEDMGTDFCWGDAGKFYFYIRRDALANNDFSDTRVYFEN